MNSTRNHFLDTASRIGARICRDAIWSDGRCNWLGDSMEKLDGTWKVAHRALGPDLYGGTSGIALFLDRLYSFTGETLLRETAEGAMRQACSRVSQLPPNIKPSLYLGVSGIAYTLTAMGLEDSARRTLEALTPPGEPQEEAGGQGLDVIGGIAGAIPALLNMSLALSDQALLANAIRFGEDLIRLARVTDAGYSWNTLNVSPHRRRQDLTGFSHGVSGIAWALSELFEFTNDTRFRKAAGEGRRYERSYFDPQRANWPDFRYLYDEDSVQNDGPSYPVSWCHGAPGIGLERLRAYEIFACKKLRDEAEMAIRTTETSLMLSKNSNFSLCHGLAGNADLLINAASALNDPARMARAEQLGDEGIESFESQDLRWPCGVTEGDQTPNLMLGTAGVGHFYLRLYDPVKAPSVLILPSRAHMPAIMKR